MAQKTIGELELKASILTTDNVVVDDGTNSYKATVAQLATAVLPAQTSNNFKALQTNGSTTFWGDLNTGALCSTAGATAAKTVDFTNFVLSNFCKISVKFSNANTADSPTLNVNGTGAKSIKINNSTSTIIYFPANTIIDFIYDGSDWIMENKIVESYISGANWYKIYADGWKEQGGTVTATTDSTNVSLGIAFIGTVYNVSVTSTGNRSANVAVSNLQIPTRTTGYFTLLAYANERVAPIMWEARGY